MSRIAIARSERGLTAKQRRARVLDAAIGRRTPVFEALESRQMLSLVMQWHMDENGGSTINDTSGTGNNGDIPIDAWGTSWVAGRFGASGIGFDGQSGRIAANNFGGTLGNTSSLALWINTAAVGNDTVNLAPGITGGDDTSATNSDIYWGILDASGRIGFGVADGQIKSLNRVNDGQWHHVAMTRDANTGDVKLYVDGFLNSTGKFSTGTKDIGGAGMGDIGVMRDQVGNYSGWFTGSIDELNMYNHVLTDNEVGRLFDPTNTAPAAPTGLAVAAAGTTAVRLTWTDTAQNNIGYKIERALSTTPGAFSEVARIGDAGTYTDRGLTPSTGYIYRIRAFNVTGDSAYSNSVNATTIAVAPAGNGTGLLGYYYDEGGVPVAGSNPQVVDPTTNFFGKVYTRVDPTVDFNWAAGAPIASMGVDNFSTRWVGQIEAQYSEKYTFYSQSDDGAFLWIDLKDGVGLRKVIDDPTYHGMTAANEKNSEALFLGGIQLVAGQKYDIVFEQFENGGDAGARLMWESISNPKGIIPSTQLFPFQYTSAPAGATNLTAAVSTTSPATAISLSWQDNANNEVGYHVMRSPTGAAGTFVKIADVAGTTYTDAVFPGQTYYYQLVAFNLFGESGASNVANATSQALPSGQGVLGLYYNNRTLAGFPDLIRVDSSRRDSNGPVAGTGVIDWPDINSDADPNDNLQTGVAGIDDGTQFSVRWVGTFTATQGTGAYTFFTRTDDDVRLWINGQRLIAAPSAQSFTVGRGLPTAPGDTGVINLTAGQTYPFMVEYGQGTGGAGAEVRWKFPGMTTASPFELLPAVYSGSTIMNASLAAPTAPTNLTSTGGILGVTLRWNDTALTEFNNRVEMSTDNGATWSTFTTLAAASNTAGAASTQTYRVSPLQPDTNYKFRIVSYNIQGEAVSNELAVKTGVLVPLTGTQAPATGDTNLTTEGNLSWYHWGQGNDANVVNAPGTGSTTGNVIKSVTVTGSDTAISGGVQAQRENDLGGAIVPFGEGVFAYTDRTHNYTNMRFTAAGAPSTNAADTLGVIPPYLLGNEYVSTMNGNRDNANLVLSVAVNRPVRAYLLIDNRTGDTSNANPPTLSDTVMGWVARDGWAIMNTGTSPNGQPDMVALDEGGTPATFAERSDPSPGAGVGINQYFTIYFKDFAAGSTIQTFQADNAGQNMYGLVVQALGGTNLTTIGTGTLQPGDTPNKTFTWTGGFPNDAVTATTDAVTMAGANNGISFTVPASNLGQRRIKIYVGADETRGQLTATMSDGSKLPFVDSSVVDSGAGITTAVYTILYKAELANQSLKIDWVSLNPTGKVYLSAASIAEAEPPAAPTNLSAAANNNGSVTLNWTDTANNETGYKIERKTGAAGTYAEIAVANPGASYTDNTGLTPGQEYFYRIRATGLGGDSEYSNEASVIALLGAPANVFADGRNSALSLSWDAVSGAISYVIKRADAVGGPYTDLTEVNGTSYVDTTAAVGQRYFYTITAKTATLTSAESRPAVGTAMEGSPYARVNFTAAGGQTYDSYLNDIGEVYAARNGLEYGWTENNTGTSRNRNDNSAPLPYDERYDSLNHLQNPTNATTTTDRVWEIAVPNGTYYVHVVGGDIGNTDSNIGFNIEGTLTGLFPIRTVAGETSGDGSPIQERFKEFYVVVQVTDGKLTIRTDLTSPKPDPDVNTGNAGNNKINYIDVNQVAVVQPKIDIVGNATAETWYVKRDGADVKVWNNADGSGAPAQTVPFATMTDFNINGGGEADTLILNLTGGALFPANGLNVAGGKVKLQLIGGDSVTLPAVQVAPGALLDLGTNDLVIQNATYANIAPLVASARAGSPRWTGPGIGTSSANADQGLVLDQVGADVKIKFTWNGDLNMDGRVNADDYFYIDQGFLQKPTPPKYHDGDFNFDGKINADDYFLIDQAFLNQKGQILSAPKAALGETVTAMKKTAARQNLFSSLKVKRQARKAARIARA